MLADPQTVTISSVAVTLPRLEERPETNVYSNRTENVDLYITQKVDNKNTARATSSLVKSVIVTDSITGLKSRVPYSITVGLSQPLGVTNAEMEALFDAHIAALQASTKALFKKLQAGER